MNHDEFYQFVRDNGKAILRFCRMTCGDKDTADELYQDTMLTLLGKRRQMDSRQNAKSYALSVSILLWKNRQKKYANRNRLVPMDSIEKLGERDKTDVEDTAAVSPENHFLKEDEKNAVRRVVANLPEKYRIPIYLYYSADLSVQEIARVLQVPKGTVKSRMNKARHLLKKELEDLGYDR